MATLGRAILYIEPDEQYTLLIFKGSTETNEDTLQSSTSNLTLANAFNTARDAPAAMATGAEKHRQVTISTRIST